MEANKWQRWKEIMKCYPFEEKRLSKWTPPFIVQPKYDGVRCRAIPVENGYLLLSSEGNPIFSVPKIVQSLNELRYTDLEFDGELYSHGMSFDDILSITSRTVNLHENHEAIKFHIFDIVTNEPQGQRILRINNIFNGLYFDDFIEESPYWICETLEDVKRAYDKLITMGYEGIVIRNILGAYERSKRSRFVMKFKPKKSDIYNIIGWNEEVSASGVPKGRIGSLIFSSQTGDKFAASAGLDFDEKDELWKIRDQLSGKKAKISYQHLTSRQIPKGTFNIEII
jgi:ATP-dependent DNA ligase